MQDGNAAVKQNAVEQNLIGAGCAYLMETKVL